MRKNIQILILCFTLALGFQSCKQTTQSFMPVVTGASGELLVLLNKPIWNSSTGDSLRNILQDEQIGLPQQEPMFNILHLSHDAFSSMFKTHRNIMDIRVSSKYKKTKFVVKNGFYATNQAFMRVDSPSEKELKKFLHENRSQIVSYFIKAEKHRKVKTYKAAPVKDIFEKLKTKNQFLMYFPYGYVINTEAEDFFFFFNETPRTSQGMFIYTYDYTSEDMFSLDEIISKRDSLLKQHVPGPMEGSFMTTEKMYPATINHFEFKGNYALETRGLWKVENDFMGGPFLNVSFLDSVNNRIICFDCYVYNPNKNKRELLRDVEAIMYTYQKLQKTKS